MFKSKKERKKVSHHGVDQIKRVEACNRHLATLKDFTASEGIQKPLIFIYHTFKKLNHTIQMIYLITGNVAMDTPKGRVKHTLLSSGCGAKIFPLLKHNFLAIIYLNHLIMHYFSVVFFMT